MKITIFGAGSIGCYLGAVLHHNGLQPLLYGRPRLLDPIAGNNGFTTTDYLGHQITVQQPTLSSDPNDLKESDIVLLAVKCTAIKQTIRDLYRYCRKPIIIISLQNGIGSQLELQKAATTHGWYLIRGLVSFNVVQTSAYCFHQSTEGGVYYDANVELPDKQRQQLNIVFKQLGNSHIQLNGSEQYDALAYAKLQLNLNNAINALADIPLKEELQQLPYRLILAAAMHELLIICKQKQYKLPRLTRLPATLIPHALKLPDFLFRRLANSMLNIDPQARSSMWDDIQNNRPTEVDYLNGAVVKLAEMNNMQAPVNTVLQRWIHERENGHRQPPFNFQEFWDEVEDLEKQ